MNLIIQLRRGASGLGVELDVKNKVVGLITGGQAEVDGLVKINDAVVAVDGVVLGAKRLPEVLAPGRPRVVREPSSEFRPNDDKGPSIPAASD